MTAMARVIGPHPVIGQTVEYLGGPFGSFETPTIHGLAWVRDRGRRLDLLAVFAVQPGRGDFRRFLGACIAAYQVIGIWEIWNAELAACLRRRGFVAATLDTDPWTTGLLWMRAA